MTELGSSISPFQLIDLHKFYEKQTIQSHINHITLFNNEEDSRVLPYVEIKSQNDLDNFKSKNSEKEICYIRCFQCCHQIVDQKIEEPELFTKNFDAQNIENQKNDQESFQKCQQQEDLSELNSEINDNSRNKPNQQRVAHRNVFQNFGYQIIKMTLFHSNYNDKIINFYGNDSKQIASFHFWVKKNVKLVQKADYIRYWTIYKQDSSETKKNQQLFQELSKYFLENFALQYILSSQKLTDTEIHIRTIGPLLNCLSNIENFQNFRPVEI